MTDRLSTLRFRRLSRALTYGAVVALTLGILGWLVRTQFDPLVRADQRAIEAATDYTRAHEGFQDFAHFWQEMTQPFILYSIAAVVCLWAWRAKGLTTRALWAVATMATGWALSALIKLLVGRARPVIDDPISHSAGYSFPSGHATNAAIFSTVLVLLLWPLLSATARVVAWVLAMAIVLVTCLDRLFMGAHFPSDVVGGVVLGCGLALASYAGYRGWSPPRPSTAHTPPSTRTRA